MEGSWWGPVGLLELELGELSVRNQQAGGTHLHLQGSTHTALLLRIEKLFCISFPTVEAPAFMRAVSETFCKIIHN